MRKIKRPLEILACPMCKSKLYYDHSREELVCRVDKLAFPISDNGVPIMLVEKARKIV